MSIPGLPELPIPEMLPYLYKLLIWLIVVLLIIIAFFIYHHFKVYNLHLKKIGQLTDKNSESLDEMHTHLNAVVLQLKQSHLDFQEKISDVIQSLKSDVLDLRVLFDKVTKKISYLNSHVDGEIKLSVERIKKLEDDFSYTNKSLITEKENVWKIIERHEEALLKGAKIFKLQNDKMNIIKTDIKKLGDNLIMVTTKKDRIK